MQRCYNLLTCRAWRSTSSDFTYLQMIMNRRFIIALFFISALCMTIGGIYAKNKDAWEIMRSKKELLLELESNN